MIKNFKIQFLLLVVSNFFFTACPDPRVCAKPEPDQKTIKIPIRMPLNSTISGCQSFPSLLLTDFKQKGNSALTSSFKNKSGEWLIEATVFGTCGGSTAWTNQFKFADLPTSSIDEKGTVSTTMINNVERMVLEFPKIPTTTGKVVFDVQIYSPCILTCPTSSVALRSKYTFSVEVQFPAIISGSQHEIDIRDALYNGNVQGICK